MKKIEFKPETLAAIIEQAEREFPSECCGFIVGGTRSEEVRAIHNIQDQKHAENPTAHPRDARTAFLMDPKEHLAVLTEVDLRRIRLKAIYHSHPDHDAYFSETDRRQACSFDPGEPDYPDIAHIVLSIIKGKFNRAAAFVWDAERKQFVEAPLVESR